MSSLYGRCTNCGFPQTKYSKKTIRKIFKLRERGRTLKDIAERITDDGEKISAQGVSDILETRALRDSVGLKD